MKSSDPENTANGLVRYKPGRRFYVFIISLVIASGFWVLNALNKSYSEELTIQIKYLNLPENRAFSPIPYTSIDINITGDGYSLMQLQETAEEDTVYFDLNQLEFENWGGKKRAQVPTSQIVNSLRNELNNNINISRVSRDTLEVITEIGIQKEMKIVPDVHISVAKGMVLKKPIYTLPNVVDVSGPISILESLSQLETEPMVWDEVSEDMEVNVRLTYNSRFVIPEYSSVKIIAEVEALTEGEIDVPIQIVGLPENQLLRLLPEKVSIKYSTGLSHYDYITPELFDVVVNYKDVIKNASKIPVYIWAVPSYVNVIQMYPEQIGYLKMDL